MTMLSLRSETRMPAYGSRGSHGETGGRTKGLTCVQADREAKNDRPRWTYKVKV